MKKAIANFGFAAAQVEPRPQQIEAVRRCLNKAVGENRAAVIVDAISEAVSRSQLGDLVDENGAPAGAVAALIGRVEVLADKLLLELSADPAANALWSLMGTAALKRRSRPIGRQILQDLVQIRVALAQAREDVPSVTKGGDMHASQKALARDVAAIFEANELPIETRANGLLAQVLGHALMGAGLNHSNPDRLIARSLAK